MEKKYNYKTYNYKRKSNSRKKTTKHKAKHSNNRYKKRKLNKKKVFMVIILPLIIIFMINNNKNKNKNEEKEVQQTSSEISSQDSNSNTNNTSNTVNTANTANTGEKEGTEGSEKIDWRIRLANYDNLLPEDFEVELANIDSTRQFDARAIKYLKDMINAMKKAGHTNIWVQSAYRSVKRQKELYDNSINKYLKQGKTQEEAEKLTLEYINKPGGSDHNLGLAVDFNYVDNSFEETKEYKWLLEYAEDYGFILRYPKEKENITKIAYESWHWRYVGEEHAKKMNELNMCLEEYVEYLLHI